jgi:hypothetical protein
MNKMNSKQGSGFRVQDSGFSGRQHSTFSIRYSSFIPHPSSLIPHPMQKPGNKLPGPRRGVLLLLVLALLALFALVAVAFVVISGQSQRSAKNMQRVDQTLEEPQKLLNEAMMQLARGPSNPVSVMGPHSLLEDVYGNGSRVGAVVNNIAYPYSTVAGGQLIQIGVQLPVPPSGKGNLPAPMLSSPLNWCSGMVITFLNGPRTMGHSTRIVTHIPLNAAVNPATPDFFQIVADDAINYNNIMADLNDLNGEALYYLINSPPFSGTGFGFNPATGKLDLAYNLDPANLSNQYLTTTPSSTTLPVALLPNMPLTAYSSPLADPLIRNPQSNPPGGANEDYDAADYQNMALGAQFTQMIIPNLSVVTGVIPSFHRPALANYWFNWLYSNPNSPVLASITDPVQRWNAIIQPYGTDYNLNTASTKSNWPFNATIANYIVNFKRRFLLRPLPEDNPDFTGSNPTSRTFNSSTSPVSFWERDANLMSNSMGYRWDVDNDGDGVADSIWIDLGFPVRAAKNGKLYKPLFAILCEDMDGRLNLNAHGDLAQTLPGYYPQAGIPPDPTFPINYFAGNPPTLPPTIRGRGFGPADINLYYVLQNNLTLYQQLLSGNGTFEGRYGSDGVPGASGTPYFSDIASPALTIDHSQRAYNDYLSANKWFEFDGLYSNSFTKQPAIGMQPVPPLSPPNFFKVNSELPDPVGQGVLGVDTAGRPILQGLWGSNFLDLPYEMNLGPATSRGLPSPSNTPDNPFSVNELERILRPFDRDAASLPARLAALTSTTGLPRRSALFSQRHEVTTESWDLPTLSPGLPPHILTQVQTDLAAGSITANQISWLPPHKVTDLLKAYYYYQLRNPPPLSAITPYSPIDAANQAETMVNSMSYLQLTALFPPEMLAGLKMNINRPFPGPGTGASNDPTVSTNYDPNSFGKAALWQSLGAGGSYGNFWFGQFPDFPDGTYDNTYPGGARDNKKDPFAARQRYARYLYVLALLLRDPVYDPFSIPPTNLRGQAQWFTEALTDSQKEELTRRRIAQWAINTACFKVNDSIMVPFEYDTFSTSSSLTYINPPLIDFSLTPPQPILWRVDGNLTTKELVDPANPLSQVIRGVVWGCKPPELILTETLAFHDRRIADTRWDRTWMGSTGGSVLDNVTPHDPDYDQTRIPQGSAFFELYCTRDFHGSTPPPDLYDTSTGKLDLGRLAPADANGRQYPVWRLVIGASNTANPLNNVVSRFASNTDSFTPQPQQFVDAPSYLQYPTNPPNPPNTPSSDETSLLQKSFSTTTQITIDRIVWFANLQPITNIVNPTTYHADADRIYYNRSQPIGTPVLLDRGHYVVVGPRATTILGLTSDITTDPTNYNKTPLGKPSNQRIILSSDIVPVKDLNGTFDPKIDDPGNPSHINQNNIKLPLEIIAAGGGPGTNWPSTFAATSPAAPNGIGISISEPLFSSGNYYPEPKVKGPDNITEWYGDWKMVNPDPLTNGGYFLDTPLDKDPGRPLGDPNDKVPYTGTQPNYKTVFLQRLANPLAPYDPVTNPYLTVDWMPIDLTVFDGDFDDNSGSSPIQDPDEVLSNPRKAINFATRQRGNAASNYNIWAPISDDPTNSTKAGSNAYFDYNLTDHHSLGYLNQAFQDSSAPYWITFISGRPAELYGDPSVKPFPWLPWFGRPYVNQLELMLVPSSHPARLLWEFQPCTASTDNYTPLIAGSAPFPQLLNFLQSGSANGMNQFGRILDYVGVPSWFEGTEIQVNPNAVSPPPAYAPSSPGSHTFFPPYNSISTYREPGRINLNTIYSQGVFNGLMNGNQSPTWDQFKQNRRGYMTATNNELDFDPANLAPTEFNNPFRSGGSVYWNPVPPTPTREINATYLRPSPTASDPLFQQSPLHLTPPQSQQDVNNTDRNPFFHYQGLERMGNLVTTRSNVYSVWITVGYFEVKPNRFTTPAGLPDLAHPDGYELGQEMGSDTGEIVRHRAFYMIDRTIPVGFQRGQDLNVEKAIILKRYIE